MSVQSFVSALLAAVLPNLAEVPANTVPQPLRSGAYAISSASSVDVPEVRVHRDFRRVTGSECFTDDDTRVRPEDLFVARAAENCQRTYTTNTGTFFRIDYACTFPNKGGVHYTAMGMLAETGFDITLGWSGDTSKVHITRRLVGERTGDCTKS